MIFLKKIKRLNTYKNTLVEYIIKISKSHVRFSLQLIDHLYVYHPKTKSGEHKSVAALPENAICKCWRKYKDLGNI